MSTTVPEVQFADPSERNQEPRRETVDARGYNPEDDEAAIDDAGVDTDRLLIYGAKQIIRLFVPVTLCMLLVVTLVSSIPYFTRVDGYTIYTPFHTENADVGTKVWENLSNALIFIAVIVVVTILLVLLYKYRCYKLIYGWLIFTSVLILFLFCFLFSKAFLGSLGIFFDTITFSILLWNIGVIGMVSLYWKSPLLVQQAYLILISAMMALFFIKFFPEWTVWFLLGLLAVWDLIAVLCPKGPLRVLVEIAQEREEPLMPAMIYSTTAVWGMMADTGNSPPTANNEQQEEVRVVDGSAEPVMSSVRARSAISALNGNSTQPNEEPRGNQPERMTAASRTARNLREIQDEVLSREDRGVKLGLGDFVFYSVLVGRASSYDDWNTTLACTVAILIGMCFTLLLLAIRGHALPALPISIIFGLVFLFSTSKVISPFTNELASQQVFI